MLQAPLGLPSDQTNFWANQIAQFWERRAGRARIPPAPRDATTQPPHVGLEMTALAHLRASVYRTASQTFNADISGALWCIESTQNDVHELTRCD